MLSCVYISYTNQLKKWLQKSLYDFNPDINIRSNIVDGLRLAGMYYILRIQPYNF